MHNLKLGFGILLFVLFSGAAYTSIGFHRLAMYFPFAVSVIGVILSGVYVGKLIFTRRQGQAGPSSETAVDSIDAVTEVRKALPYLAWFLGYILLISLAGIVAASVVFLAAFLYREARMRWWGVVVSITSTLVLLLAFSRIMRLYWPRNLLGL